MNKKITIRPEEHKDYKSIISLILRSFQEGTDYSDGNDIIAIVMLAPVSVHADYFHQGIGSDVSGNIWRILGWYTGLYRLWHVF